MSEEIILTDTPAIAGFDPVAAVLKLATTGADPAVIERFSALAEKWAKDLAEKAYNSDMNACQREMPTVVREEINQSTKKKYAPVEAVQRVAKPIYIKYGFALSFSTSRTSREGFYDVTCDVMHKQGHTVRHTLHDVPLDNVGPRGDPNKTAVQGMMSIMSYGLGRLIRMIFNITVADEDKDGQKNSNGLTPEQTDKINMMLKDAKSSQEELCAYLQVESVSDIPVSRFDEVCGMIERRIKRHRDLSASTFMSQETKK